MQKILYCFISIISFHLSGCDTSTANATSDNATLLTGTAATGVALIGSVTVKGAQGNRVTAEIAADGQYNINVTSLIAPYKLKAEGSVGGYFYRLHSYAEDADTTVNITPFTDLIIANASGMSANAFFESSAEMDSQNLFEQEEELKSKLAQILFGLGLDFSINLLNTPFKADHTGLDSLLDLVSVDVDEDAQTAKITNLLTDQEITDDLSKPLDNIEPFTIDVGRDLIQVAKDIKEVTETLSRFSALFVDELPSFADVIGYFSDDFTFQDYSANSFANQLTSDQANIGFTISSPKLLAIDDENNEMRISLSIESQTVNFLDTWYFIKNDSGNWVFDGDRKPVIQNYFFDCTYELFNTRGCDLRVFLRDRDFSNTPSPMQGIPIASARVRVEKEGAVLYEYFFGNRVRHDGQLLNIQSDGTTQGTKTEIFSVSQMTTNFTQGARFKIDLYTEELATLSPPSVGEQLPIATIYDEIRSFPIVFLDFLDSDEIPEVTDAQLIDFETYVELFL